MPAGRQTEHPNRGTTHEQLRVCVYMCHFASQHQGVISCSLSPAARCVANMQDPHPATAEGPPVCCQATCNHITAGIQCPCARVKQQHNAATCNIATCNVRGCRSRTHSCTQAIASTAHPTKAKGTGPRPTAEEIPTKAGHNSTSYQSRNC